MNIRTLAAAALSTAAVGLFAAGPASAQATRTWVSGVGDDANPCSRTAPCKTLGGAISKTAAGGEISILDPGGFGPVTITKSISINGEWAGEAGVLVSGSNGIIVNAGANDVVNLRGLFMEGLGTGLSGVYILSAGEVHMQDMVIRDFRSGAAAGVNVAPSTNPVKVTIDNSLIANNGTVSAGGGVIVRPTGSATAQVVVTRSTLVGNAAGVRVDGDGGTGAAKAQVADTTASDSLGQGFLAITSTGGPAQLFLDRVKSTNNGSVGVRVDGANATVTVGRSTFTGNGGPGMQAKNGGVLNSYRDNQSLLNGAPDSATVQVTPN